MVLKYKLRNEGIAFTLQMTRHSVAWIHDHIMAVPSPVGDVKLVSPISTSLLKKKNSHLLYIKVLLKQILELNKVVIVS